MSALDFICVCDCFFFLFFRRNSLNMTQNVFVSVGLIAYTIYEAIYKLELQHGQSGNAVSSFYLSSHTFFLSFVRSYFRLLFFIYCLLVQPSPNQHHFTIEKVMKSIFINICSLFFFFLLSDCFFVSHSNVCRMCFKRKWAKTIGHHEGNVVARRNLLNECITVGEFLCLCAMIQPSDIDRFFHILFFIFVGFYLVILNKFIYLFVSVCMSCHIVL